MFKNRYVYAFIIITIITLGVWIANRYIAILPAQAINEIAIIVLILTAVVSILSGYKDIAELIEPLISRKKDQTHNVFSEIVDIENLVSIFFRLNAERQNEHLGRLHNPHSTSSFEFPAGTMEPNSPFYIDRSADALCIAHILQHDVFSLHIQAPRQAGKSSLLRRTCWKIKQERDVHIVHIEFEKFSERQLNNFESFLIEFCNMIHDELDIRNRVANHWHKEKNRSQILICTQYIFNYILPSIEKPLVLAMDEVERITGRSYQNDFFGMLRTWHNDRAKDPIYKKLSMFLSSSTEPNLFISNVHQSPFNVAEQVTLQDFAPNEIERLNYLYRSPLDNEQLLGLMNLLDGHPFLTRIALYRIAIGEYDFDQLLRSATSDDGPFRIHLRHFWHLLSSYPDLSKELQLICLEESPSLNNNNLYRLESAGLLKQKNGEYLIRNKLYSMYFMERFRG